MATQTAPFPFAGTVSSGTMQSVDLIPAFADVLRELSPNSPLLPECDEIMERTERGPWGRSFGTAETEEEAQNLLYDLFDTLDGLAPEGFYFGASEGDGADYGFWRYEEEGE